MRSLKFASAFLISLVLLLAAPLSAQGALTRPTVESADVAAMAAQTLANSGSKESIPVLRRMLNHPSLIVRYYAAYGLGKLGDKESVKALNDSLWLKENDTPDEKSNPPFSFDGPTRMIYLHGGYRQMVCWALRQLGDTSADKRFIEILEDPDTTSADMKKRIAELIVQLGDVKWEKREEAQKALSEIGDPARRQLEEAVKSIDMEVAQRASELLKPHADTSLTRRVEAFRCLGQLGTEAAFKAMCKVAENDKVDFVAKGYSIRLRDKFDSGLTPEQHKTLVQLSGKNKNLPNRGQGSEPRVQPPNPMAAKIDAAKSAQALKDLFIEQQKAGASGLENIIYAMRDYELGEVEDWMVNYISDSHEKKADNLQQGACRAMLYVLNVKGTEKCLPLLQSLLEDDKLGTSFRLAVLKDIHTVLGRCKPERRDLLVESVDEYTLTMMLKNQPDDAKFLIESSKMKREEVEDKMLEVLRRPAVEPAAMQVDSVMRGVCFWTLLARKSPKLVDYAIEGLEKSNGKDGRASSACTILKTLDRKDKLPDLKKFYERTHYDRNGIVTRTMYLLGDKDVPKMVLAEARAGKPDEDTLECNPYLRLLMYEDINCQKYFFDSLMKGVPGLERVLNDMLYNYAVGYGIGSNPVNFELAASAIEKILMNSPSGFRAYFLRELEEYALDEPALRQAIQRYAEHAMDVCEQARKLIPQLGDKNADARKKTREELEKLGLDAAPAFAEFDKYPDPEIQKVLKELLESCKSRDTGY